MFTIFAYRPSADAVSVRRIPAGRELSTEGDQSSSRDHCTLLIITVCYRDVAATMAHDHRTALRYYDVLGSSAANRRLSGFVSLHVQRDRLERPEGESDSDLVPDCRPSSPAPLPAAAASPEREDVPPPAVICTG